MLRIDNQNMSLNAVSAIDDVVIANFNASHDGRKNLSLNIYIEDFALFAEHKEMVDEDFIAFGVEALEIVESMNA